MAQPCVLIRYSASSEHSDPVENYGRIDWFSMKDGVKAT